MDEINAIAEKYSLPVIEDAAQSLGAEYKGRKSCNLSTIGCTSFFPSKPLGCYGDGGAVFTNDDSLAKIMREIRVHGQEKRYYHTRIGVGGRMDTLQCAIVLAKLEHFPYDVARRRHLGGVYSQALDGLSGLRPIVVRPYCRSVYGQYTVITDRRERLQEALKRMGVPTAVHYPLGLHQQPALRERCIHHGLPITEAMARQVLSLPMHPHLTEEAILTIQGAMAEALRE
jgi:UDP-2-acetamido-2-deoxy-ribo-hexuluronate aminotransferase